MWPAVRGLDTPALHHTDALFLPRQSLPLPTTARWEDTQKILGLFSWSSHGFIFVLCLASGVIVKARCFPPML